MVAKTIMMNDFRVLDVSGTGTPSGVNSIGPFIAAADNEPERATFGCGALGITPAATPTDFITITGAAGKIIRVKSILLSGFAGTTGSLPFNLIRRSAANTGGTSTAVTGYAHDTSDGSPSATIKYYTANPSGLGTTVGTIHAGRLAIASSPASIDRAAYQYSWQNDKAIILRSASDILAISFGGATVPSGGAIDFDLLWTEE